MRPSKTKLALLASALLLAIPVLGQDSPESLLPPGFGDPIEDDKPPPKPRETGPQDLLPPDDAPTGGNQGGASRPSGVGSTAPGPGFDLGSLPPATDGKPGDEKEDGEEAQYALPDLPPHARRSTANVGVLSTDDGDMGAGAFGSAPGKYLAYLMRKTPAPIASRWGSITLRRALLSRVDTPIDIGGAELAAERAWLLLRMGEADAARMLVQAVDADQYSPWMREVAMQSALASADPAGLCPATEGNPATGKDPYWKMARAICSAFSGESALASALVGQVDDNRAAPTIDILLSEKIVGAASNTRRAVNILWEDTNKLTAWRYGLATAAALKIPDPLMASVGPHVRAWRARAPLIALQDRTADIELATAMGVFSSAALVDHYGAVTDIAESAGSSAPAYIDSLGSAFGDADPESRIASMSAIWSSSTADETVRYARQIATARAAADLPPGSGNAEQTDNLIASMLSAGLDVQAARWAPEVSGGSLAWALLSVGSPNKFASISDGAVTGLDAGATGKRAQFLLAGLAGLGRISPEQATGLADDLDVQLSTQNVWTKAINRAADARQPATVALLAGLGLHADKWSGVSAVHLYNVVSALRRVGLEAEARMIAAEAVMRG